MIGFLLGTFVGFFGGAIVVDALRDRRRGMPLPLPRVRR